MFRSLILISLLVAGSFAAGATYNTDVTVANVALAGTDSWIYMRFHGENGPSPWAYVNLSGVNDLERAATYHYTYDLTTDVGQVSVTDHWQRVLYNPTFIVKLYFLQII